MRQRKQPFGYIIQGGKIVAEPQEASMVRWIFSGYVNGNSYAKLASDLNKRDTAYFAGKAWNKNMVARILADHRYLGQDEHPPLVEQDLFDKAASLRPGRYAPEKRDPAIKELQRLAKCGCCGDAIKRISHQHGRERWQCPTCKSISPKVSDSLLLQSATQVLNALIQDPTQVIEPPPAHIDNSLPILRLQSELDRELDKPECDENAARAIIRDMAAARFAKLGSADYESERIRRLLNNATPDFRLNIALLRSITKSVLVHGDGTLDLELANGQIMEGSVQPC